MANLTGRPSISLPLVRARVDGVTLPIGVMLTGRRGADATLLRLAAALEAGAAGYLTERRGAATALADSGFAIEVADTLTALADLGP